MKLFKAFNPKEKLAGLVTVPPDKSIAQRSIILSGIAHGISTINNFPLAVDPQSTLKVMQSLGVQVQNYTNQTDKLSLQVHGKGMSGLKEAEDILDCGNSGTCFRLMMGLLAGNPNKHFAVLTGDQSLRKRPMKRVSEALNQLGADIWGRNGSNYAPIALKGKRLNGGSIKTPIPSAQLKSSLLLAGLNCNDKLSIEEPEPSRNHSELMLKQFGAKIEQHNEIKTTIWASELKACEINIPGDISSAAFILAATLIVPESKVTIQQVGLNSTRSGILNVLKKMGADISVEINKSSSYEPFGDITVKHSPLRGIEIGGSIIPNIIDELPILSLLASQASGQTIIKDAAELRIKESDRLKTMAQVLKSLGITVEELPDGMVIDGCAGKPFNPIDDTFDSYHDHRIAMTVGIASLFCTKDINLIGHEWADISFPGFFNLLKSLLCE